MRLKNLYRSFTMAKEYKGDLDPNWHNYNKNILDPRLSHAWEGRIFLPKKTS